MIIAQRVEAFINFRSIFRRLCVPVGDQVGDVILSREPHTSNKYDFDIIIIKRVVIPNIINKQK